METKKLPTVTLLGIDCLQVERLQTALDICETGIEFAEVKLLTSLPTTDSRRVEIPHLGSVEAYSEFCIRNLSEYVDTEHVLIVQWYGFILNPQSWTDDFLQYDYIGAPVHIDERDFWFSRFSIPKSMAGKSIIGNGGFCLRSKKFLEHAAVLAQAGVFTGYQPEDLQLCFFKKQYFLDAGLQYAPYEVACSFSLEGREMSYENQFGFHGFDWTDISKWIQENPQWGIEQTLKE